MSMDKTVQPEDLEITADPSTRRLVASVAPGLFPCGGCAQGWRREIVDGYECVARCQCLKYPMAAERFNAARFPVSAADAVLANWCENGKRPSAQAAADWVAAFKPRCKGSLFIGGNGIGKTWMVHAIARWVVFRGYTVRVVSWSGVLDELRDGYAAEYPESKVTSPLLGCDLLVVDDVGQEQRTEWSGVACERILGRRLEDGGTTLITSNAGTYDDLLEIVGARVFSRMMGACVAVRMTGDDLRVRKLKGGAK